LSVIPFKNTNPLLDRLPPQNVEAEMCVLGSVLLDNETHPEVASILRAEDFYRDNHASLWRVISSMIESGTAVDAITLVDELERLDLLEKIGGDSCLVKILETPPHAANARYYAEIVRQNAIARAVLESAMATERDVYSGLYTAEQLLERAEVRTLRIGDRPGRIETVEVREFVRSALEEIFARAEGREVVRGLPSGFVDLDSKIGGLRGGDLAILAARPSIGKTALAMNIAEFVAERVGCPVLFISLEMSRRELAERLLSSRSGVGGSTILHPMRITDDERTSLSEAADLCSGLPIWVDDTPSMTAHQIAASARRLKAACGLGMVIVDYLQLVQSQDDRQNRQEQVAQVTRRLKTLSRDLDVPVLALCQINRDAEKREDRRPRMSDIRESGEIEAAAHSVMLLHRPEFYDPNDQPGMAELILAKNRSGATGTIKLTFEKHLTRFSNYHADPQAHRYF